MLHFSVQVVHVTQTRTLSDKHGMLAYPFPCLLQARGTEHSTGSALLIRGGPGVSLLLRLLLHGTCPTWPLEPPPQTQASTGSAGGATIAGLSLRSTVPLSAFSLQSAGSNHAVHTLSAPGTQGRLADLPQLVSPTPFAHGAAVPLQWRRGGHPGPQGQGRVHTLELCAPVPAPLACALAAVVQGAHIRWHTPPSDGPTAGASVTLSADAHRACTALSRPAMRAAVQAAAAPHAGGAHC